MRDDICSGPGSTLPMNELDGSFASIWNRRIVFEGLQRGCTAAMLGATHGAHMEVRESETNADVVILLNNQRIRNCNRTKQLKVFAYTGVIFQRMDAFFVRTCSSDGILWKDMQERRPVEFRRCSKAGAHRILSGNCSTV